MRPSDELLRSVLRTLSARDAIKKLTAEGYEVGHWRCNQMRKILLEEGEAAVINNAPRNNRWAGPVDDEAEVEAGVTATEQLEERICALYERRARELGCSFEAAFRKLNYSRAQLEKMAA